VKVVTRLGQSDGHSFLSETTVFRHNCCPQSPKPMLSPTGDTIVTFALK
jgi:hypothetical protein